jgi:acetyl-CoA carboxylase biotin carboxyl carrier protein
MDFEAAERAIKLMKMYGLTEFELREGDKTLRFRDASAEAAYGLPQMTRAPLYAPGYMAAELQAGSAQAPAPAQPAAAPVTTNLIEVRSPFVGTFYEASTPGAPAFAKKGQSIQVGQTLCIVEAMKLMNEIEAEVAGEIVEVCLKNEDPVEYNQVLFRVRP